MSGEYICEAIEAIMEYERINEIADLFKMFGDATRVKILFSLFDRELSVTEIVEKIGASQTAVSHQLHDRCSGCRIRSYRQGHRPQNLTVPHDSDAANHMRR